VKQERVKTAMSGQAVFCTGKKSLEGLTGTRDKMDSKTHVLRKLPECGQEKRRQGGKCLPKRNSFLKKVQRKQSNAGRTRGEDGKNVRPPVFF